MIILCFCFLGRKNIVQSGTIHDAFDFLQELPEAADPVDDDPTTHEDLMDVIQSDRHSMDNHPKDLSGLTDLYWVQALFS